jgi:hypothetical protein
MACRCCCCCYALCCCQTLIKSSGEINLYPNSKLLVSPLINLSRGNCLQNDKAVIHVDTGAAGNTAYEALQVGSEAGAGLLTTCAVKSLCSVHDAVQYLQCPAVNCLRRLSKADMHDTSGWNCVQCVHCTAHWLSASIKPVYDRQV